MKTEKGESVPFIRTFSYLLLIIIFAAIVMPIYVEPTTSQPPANVVVKLGNYLMGQSRLCEPRRTRVSFAAGKLRKVSTFIVLVHLVTYE